MLDRRRWTGFESRPASSGDRTRWPTGVESFVALLPRGCCRRSLRSRSAMVETASGGFESRPIRSTRCCEKYNVLPAQGVFCVSDRPHHLRLLFQTPGPTPVVTTQLSGWRSLPPVQNSSCGGHRGEESRRQIAGSACASDATIERFGIRPKGPVDVLCRSGEGEPPRHDTKRNAPNGASAPTIGWSNI